MTAHYMISIGNDESHPMHMKVAQFEDHHRPMKNDYLMLGENASPIKHRLRIKEVVFAGVIVSDKNVLFQGMPYLSCEVEPI